MSVRRDPRRRLSTVGGSPWAVMLRHGLIAGAAACLALVVAAAIISGGGAAASAATASAVVAVPLVVASVKAVPEGPPVRIATATWSPLSKRAEPRFAEAAMDAGSRLLVTVQPITAPDTGVIASEPESAAFVGRPDW